MSERNRNKHPELEVRPHYSQITAYNPKATIDLAQEIFEKIKGWADMLASNDCLYDTKDNYAGSWGSYKEFSPNPDQCKFEIPDPKVHHQKALPTVGRYTQNSQYDTKDPLFKTKNEFAFHFILRDYNNEPTNHEFGLILTPTGKSATLVLFENLGENFTQTQYSEAFDRRGLTKDAQEIADRVDEIRRMLFKK